MLLLLRPLFLSLSLCLLRFAVSEIQLGSRLVVGENASWVSKNGDFALGFFNPPDLPNRFSIGIRFNSASIPSDDGRRQVVWVAGAGVSVSDNTSYFELTPDGDLVLFDSSLGVPVWTSKTNRFSVSSALLRDDGNLVLLRGGEEEEIVWESFDTPADTLLPNQKLKAFEMLRAASESSRSSYYSLHMEGSGRLELRWESNITFWSSGNEAEAAVKKKIGAVLTPEGALSLVEEQTKPVWSVFGEDHNDTATKFRFLRLDRDGNLRMYSFHEESGAWRPVWQAVENQCRVFATCGSQVCSFNGSGSASSPQCTCPYNTFASVSSAKCLTPYQKLSCKSGYSMVRFENTELYGIYPANDSVVSPVSSRRCKEMCSDDPDCTAVTYKNPQCLVKLTRYVSGYSDPSLSSVSYVKTCLDPLPVDPPSKKEAAVVTEKSRSVCLPCLISASSATFVLFLAFQVGVLVYMYRRKKKEDVKRAERFSKVRNNPKGVVVFSVDEIKEMTNDFEENIGLGMFKGVITSESENELVAVKEMEGTVTEERKFRSSAAKIGTMHHKNLAKLEGYCCERGKRFLVYEYAKNGSVLDHGESFVWRKRAETWLSVAKALYYLHSECREFVSHGSLSCGNILLGDEFEAKLILYGFGSCAADKDVEDFGKVVLALVTGRYDEEGGVVSEWVYREWSEGRGENVVDARLAGEFDVEEVERVLRICFWCVQVDERLRPSMGEVVKVLEGTLSVDPPPPPFVCVRSSSPTNSSGSGQSLYESVRE
ncbi:G-type lectin S-receptor-like serine/threonine-protein kinase SD3-1 [Raphanus sativus]|uniref:Receptor-like serine/threonine-protein kinase n=1 Tax=Raphanus sativus TaxID=3726 RepID=A0A6J0NHQ6_RAPSA|nr:G-type lectin S-receptor-like serine/threonine-protein kinase SD3-1 [Raphanus sativus]KAJ4904070.1 G-type lectin S-receptor-like serine/threonine-protein kinase SD3-1 [Raphanus sativus]